MTQQRSNDDIRADLVTIGRGLPGIYDLSEYQQARMRLSEDVAPLLARVSELETENERLRLSASGSMLRYRREMARAERAEAGAAALLVKVAAVEALLPNTDEQFPIFPFQVRDALGADPSGYILIPVASLAAGLSLQEEQE